MNTSDKSVHTIVVEFKDGNTPNYFAGMTVLGGRVVAVAFDGNRLEIEQELLEALQDLIGWIPGRSAWHTDAPAKAVERARAAIAKATAA